MTKVVYLTIHDPRVPTSQRYENSDPMNTGQDYLVAHFVLDVDGMHEGHGQVAEG